jgi:hypothetical protein
VGNSNNSQQREAQRAEEQRRANVLAGQQGVERIFGTPQREAQIQDAVGATRDFLQKDLDKQNTRAQLQSKFALARGGTTGGSLDVDTNRALSESYLRGVTEAERRAQAAGASLRQADQSAKLNLFGMIQSGLDQTTAARNAGEAMRSNIDSARAQSMQQGVGNVFEQFGDIYKRSRETKAKNDAEKFQYGSYYQQNPLTNRVGTGPI